MENLSAGAKAAQLWANKDAQKNIGSKGAYGEAKFLDHAELDGLGLYGGPIVLGRSSEKKIIRYAGDSHLLTVAPNGAGKGVSSVVPNTLFYPGSVSVFDTKGDITAICARARLKRGPVWIFDRI